jgi:hypothetical protein
MFNRFKGFARRGYETAKNDKAYIYLNVGTVTGLVGFCMSDPLPLRTCSITSSLTGAYAGGVVVVLLLLVVYMVVVYMWWNCGGGGGIVVVVIVVVVVL